MRVVRTALYGGIRDCALVDIAGLWFTSRWWKLRRPIATVGDLTICIRRPRQSDWVDGVFVGDR